MGLFLGGQVAAAQFGTAAHDSRDMVSQDAIDFFRHGSGLHPDACFHMDDRHMQLDCVQRTRQCGIGVAVEHQGIRFFLEQDVLHAGQGSCSHLRMAAATDTKVVVRPGDA